MTKEQRIAALHRTLRERAATFDSAESQERRANATKRHVDLISAMEKAGRFSK